MSQACGCSSSAQPAALAWAREFLPHYFTDAPARFHAELLATFEHAGARLVARVAPRGHAKSTCAALAYPLWCLCEQRRRNIVIITHELALAAQFVRDIRHELEANERILTAYGDLCGGRAVDAKPAARSGRTSRAKWSELKFTTTGGVTIHARSTGATLRGTRVGPHRPDLIICDDIEKDTVVQSPGGRQKLEHWLRRVVMPALAPDGQLLMLGSLLHHDSLLANLRDRRRFPGWDYRIYRALEAEPDGTGGYRRVALWPARWPVEKLDEERARIGTLAFEQEYQANPIDETVRAFRPEWLRRYEPSELVPERLVTLMAVDPATGADQGDYFALWIGSIDTGTDVIYTRQLVVERIDVVAQVQRILAAQQRWRPVKVAIETVGFQVALLQFLEAEGRRRGVYLPAVGVSTRANKVARIVGSALFFERGLFRLPPDLDPVVEAQFLHFPKGEHDDGPDVCAMGIELARSVFRGTTVQMRVEQRDPGGRRGW